MSEAAALQLASRLTDRDRRIALDCFEHRVLTSEQLQRLHFAGARTARARLEQLYLLRVLDRLRPPWPQGTGSAPYHWVLDEAGAHIVAEQLGLEPKELRWRRDAAIALAGSSKLRHQIEVNEFFTQLAHEARQAGENLREWWGERRALEVLDGIVAPDGYGRLAVPCQPELSFLLELDRATEDHARLRQKAKRYAKALPRSDLSAEDPIVLVAVPTAARARALEEALASSSVPIAAVPLPLALWPCAQQTSQRQRHGRYLPESNRHPGKMLPELARRAIAAYSDPGDLVLDPMCGIGTTLVEAIHLDRDALGVELERRWGALAIANIALARKQGARGRAGVIEGDARELPRLLATEARTLMDRSGQTERQHNVATHPCGSVDLIVTSPPYAREVGELDKRAWGNGGDLCSPDARNYSTDRENLGHARGRRYLRAVLKNSTNSLAAASRAEASPPAAARRSRTACTRPS